MEKLTKKHKEAMNDLVWHLIFEWGINGDAWEFIVDKSEEEKKVIEQTITWMLKYSNPA